MTEKHELPTNETKPKFHCVHNTELKELYDEDFALFKEKLAELTKFKKTGDSFGLDYCGDCGEYIKYQIVNDILQSVNHPLCFNAEEIYVDVSVPSGELLFSDWPEHGTELFGHLDKHSKSINTDAGIAQRIENYATENIIHFFVSNTSPNIEQKNNDLFIGRSAYDEEDDFLIGFVIGAKEAGSISTELWWTTAIDRLTYLKAATEKFGDERGFAMTEEAKQNAHAIVHVDPGKYRLTYIVNPDEDYRLFGTIKKLS